MAIIGGIVLCALILLVCLCVLGRSLNTLLHGPIESIAPGLSQSLLALGIGPINGDFEIVEAGIAFAIFAFIPLCQITGGHASVDIFTAMMSDRTNRILSAVIEVVFAAVLVLIAFRPGRSHGSGAATRGLVILWLAQNLLLTASAAWRKSCAESANGVDYR